VTIDRGYIDDRVLGRLPQNGDCFLTRQKVNARFNVIARFEMDWRQCSLTSDYHVVLLGQKGNAYPAVPRRVGHRGPDTCQDEVFWTTAFYRAAATVAALYI
jgi:hypothetical protein